MGIWPEKCVHRLRDRHASQCMFSGWQLVGLDVGLPSRLIGQVRQTASIAGFVGNHRDITVTLCPMSGWAPRKTCWTRAYAS